MEVSTIHVRNMVCQRCILIVKGILCSQQIKASVTLGKISIEQELNAAQFNLLADSLQQVGLEIIEDRVTRLIEDVKLAIRDYIALGIDARQYKLSAFVSSKMSYEFGYISDVFSKVEGITIERYYMLQRLEKVKEMLSYDQYSLSEIAFETGFSSVHHLSAQFKKLSGLTPTAYKQTTEKTRRPLDMVAS